MRAPFKSLGVIGALALTACVAEIPKELVDARTAYNRSLSTAAVQYAPADLYEARRLLDSAERLADSGSDWNQVRDLSYLALRRIQLAQSRARTEADWREIIAARRAVETLRERQVAAARKEAREAEQQLNAAKVRIEKEMAERDAALEQERTARQAAEARLSDLLTRLRDFAPSRHEDRGTVITISGAVLFPSGQSNLLQTAKLRLDQVAEALKAAPKDQHITVEGHTDDVGTAEFNQQLSLSRAEAVRDYLVTRGVGPDRLEAYGLGATKPLVENTTPENRANNRRVEIVIHGGPVSLR
jgi:outer membrane protein OmpA-like peptidoglycan-associated protein